MLEGHTDEVFNASFNDAGDMIITGSKDNTARVWTTFKAAPNEASLVRVTVHLIVSENGHVQVGITTCEVRTILLCLGC